jgi:hypothetical protein
VTACFRILTVWIAASCILIRNEKYPLRIGRDHHMVGAW